MKAISNVKKICIGVAAGLACAALCFGLGFLWRGKTSAGPTITSDVLTNSVQQAQVVGYSIPRLQAAALEQLGPVIANRFPVVGGPGRTGQCRQQQEQGKNHSFLHGIPSSVSPYFNR